jgi:hypothetical protein
MVLSLPSPMLIHPLILISPSCSVDSRFQQGMNTIILPRAIAIQCQLNDTLYDLQNVGSTPFNNAIFNSILVIGK